MPSLMFVRSAVLEELTLERRRCRNRHDPYFSVVTAPFVFEGTL